MSDYSTLQSDVLDILKDPQVDAAKVRDYIRWAEPKIQRDLLSNNHGGGVPRQMQARTTGQTDTNSIYALPSDYHETRSVIVGSNRATYAPPTLVAPNAAGFEEADVTLDYYQLLTQLSDVNPQNWLIDPMVGFDVYLWATCLEYVPWGHEPDVFPLWNGWYTDALRTLKATHSPRPLGGWNRKKNNQYGAYYTVIGNEMHFGEPQLSLQRTSN